MAVDRSRMGGGQLRLAVVGLRVREPCFDRVVFDFVAEERVLFVTGGATAADAGGSDSAAGGDEPALLASVDAMLSCDAAGASSCARPGEAAACGASVAGDDDDGADVAAGDSTATFPRRLNASSARSTEVGCSVAM